MVVANRATRIKNDRETGTITSIPGAFLLRGKHASSPYRRFQCRGDTSD